MVLFRRGSAVRQVVKKDIHVRFRPDFEILSSDPYSVKVSKYGLAPWGWRWLAVGEKMVTNP